MWHLLNLHASLSNKYMTCFKHMKPKYSDFHRSFRGNECIIIPGVSGWKICSSKQKGRNEECKYVYLYFS